MKMEVEMQTGTADAMGATDPTSRAEAVLDRLARLARGMVGADVERAVRDARGRARREKRDLSFADIADALAAGRPRHPERLRRRMAVHESGHAIAHLILFGSPPASAAIDLVSGGLVAANVDASMLEGLQVEAEHVLTYELAGYAAEALVLGATSAGSGGVEGSDLALATWQAGRLEGAHGWGSQHPLLFHDELALRRRLAEPAFAARVHGRLEAALIRARTLLVAHRPALDRLTEALLLAGSLEGAEITEAAGIEACTVKADSATALDPSRSTAS